MAFSIRRMGVGHLLGAWGAYWVGLAGITLGPFARWAWDLSRVPGSHGSATLSIGDAGVTLRRAQGQRDGLVRCGAAARCRTLDRRAATPSLARVARAASGTFGTNRCSHAAVARDALPDAARNGWGMPITPTSTASPLGRRERRKS